jgi:putative ABC transport system substrate-binding protein
MSRYTSGMERRTFLGTMGLAVITAPLDAKTLSAEKTYRIGVLSTAAGSLETLREGLRELGYIEGRNVILDIRDTEGKPERSNELALQLVRVKVDLIVATHPAAVFSAKRATTTIPIVMMHTPDPVQLGLAASLAHPGGNITGTTTLSVDLSIKQLELLKQAVPHASRVALLSNPNNPWHPFVVKDLRGQHRLPGVQLQMLEVRHPDDFDDAFQAMIREHARGILILADPMTFAHRRRLADLATKHRLPLMAGPRAYTEAGGLMSYWADETELGRRAASYIDRILRGTAPDDLPIEQPTKFELIINLKTARTLGLTIPQSLLLRADQVIQ